MNTRLLLKIFQTEAPPYGLFTHALGWPTCGTLPVLKEQEDKASEVHSC